MVEGGLLPCWEHSQPYRCFSLGQGRTGPLALALGYDTGSPSLFQQLGSQIPHRQPMESVAQNAKALLTPLLPLYVAQSGQIETQKASPSHSEAQNTCQVPRIAGEPPVLEHNTNQGTWGLPDSSAQTFHPVLQRAGKDFLRKEVGVESLLLCQASWEPLSERVGESLPESPGAFGS